MANQQIQLNSYPLTIEHDDIYGMALSHFKEHILPSLKEKQKLSTRTISQGISIPTAAACPSVSLQFKLEDRLLINNLRKENSELKSKVRLTICCLKPSIGRIYGSFWFILLVVGSGQALEGT